MLPKIHQWATGRNVLILIAADLLFMMSVMPIVGQKLAERAGGAGPIDLEIPTYTVDRAYELLNTYGAAGRQFYKTIELTIDLIYPLLYGFAFALALAFLWSRVAPGKRWAYYLPMLPLIGMGFDFLENIGIVTLLNYFPQRLTTVAQITSVFSLLKWSFAFPAIALVLIGFITWIIKSLQKKKSV
jgi:hypothetical protein